MRRTRGSSEPAGALRLVPPLGLIIYISASSLPRTWQALPRCSGTLCAQRPPARLSSLPPAPPGPDAPRNPPGLGRWTPGTTAGIPPPPPPHALVFGSPEPRLCSLLLLLGLGVQTWVTRRVIERFRKMLWPILKQSPIISFRRLFVPVQCQIP